MPSLLLNAGSGGDYSLSRLSRLRKLALGLTLISSFFFSFTLVAAEPTGLSAEVIARFETDTPEGLVTAPDGTLYTTLMHSSRVMRIPTSGEPELVGHVIPLEEKAKGASIGIDMGPDGMLYIAYVEASERHGIFKFFDPHHAACRDATVTRSGVYRMDPKTGVSEPLAIRAHGWPFCIPDDLTISSKGEIYLTDVTYSGIWKISADGKQVELWSDHPLEKSHMPQGAMGPTSGVNPIQLDEANRMIYVGTNFNSMLLRIPIQEDGSAGKPVAISSGYTPLDGIELDEEGNIYISEIFRNEIWVVAPDGSDRRLVADRRSAPLDNNTSLAWRDGALCTANLGFAHKNIADADKTVVCIKGFDKPTSKKVPVPSVNDFQ